MRSRTLEPELVGEETISIRGEKLTFRKNQPQ